MQAVVPDSTAEEHWIAAIQRCSKSKALRSREHHIDSIMQRHDVTFCQLPPRHDRIAVNSARPVDISLSKRRETHLLRH